MHKIISNYIKRIDNYYENQKELIGTAKIDKRLYADLNKTYTRLNWKVGTTLTILAVSIMVFSIYEDFIHYGKPDNMSMLFFGMVLLIMYNYFGRVIVVSPYGITSKSLFTKKEFAWSDVKSIGVTLDDTNTTNGDYILFFLVYVTTSDIRHPASYIKGNSERTITFRFNSKMMHHILCVCGDTDFERLYCIKKWKRYLIKNGYIEANIM